jgi:hypothetical protein
VANPLIIEFHGSSFWRKYTRVQSMVENIPPQTAKFPPIIGALSLIAIILPNARLWKPCKLNSQKIQSIKPLQRNLKKNMSTHTGGISETFNALEDRSTNSSHSEGSATIINNTPRARKVCKNKNLDRYLK